MFYLLGGDIGALCGGCEGQEVQGSGFLHLGSGAEGTWYLLLKKQHALGPWRCSIIGTRPHERSFKSLYEHQAENPHKCVIACEAKEAVARFVPLYI